MYYSLRFKVKERRRLKRNRAKLSSDNRAFGSGDANYSHFHLLLNPEPGVRHSPAFAAIESLFVL